MLLELKTKNGSVYVKHESLLTVEKHIQDITDEIMVLFRFVSNDKVSFNYYTTEENFKKFIERLEDLEN